MTRVLVTGFEPFGGADVNASHKLVETLASEPPEEIQLAAALEPEQPELVVCFGQADGRA